MQYIIYIHTKKHKNWQKNPKMRHVVINKKIILFTYPTEQLDCMYKTL